MGETLAEEYAMMLEVTMVDCPGWPHPPAFSWNAGMVMHVLKSDPALRELEHVQVDCPGVAYLFFYEGGFFRVDLYRQLPPSNGGVAVLGCCLQPLKDERLGGEPSTQYASCSCKGV